MRPSEQYRLSPTRRGLVLIEDLEQRTLLGGHAAPDIARKPQKLPPLPPPIQVVAQPRSSTEVRLEWQSDVAKRKDARFLISRSEDGKTWEALTRLKGSRIRYVDESVHERDTYWYRVRAYRGDRRSPFSKPDRVSTPARPRPPKGPLALEVVPVDRSAVRIEWLDRAGNEEGYIIHRSTDRKVFAEVGRVEADVTEFLDETPPDADTLYYRLSTWNQAGESGVTKPVGVTLKEQEVRPGLPQAIVDAAIAAPLIRYGKWIAGGAYTDQPGNGEAPLVLALAAMAGNTTADARLLEQMRYSITGGKEIAANGGYPAQHERHVTAMYAIAKLTPRIWDQLTDDERQRIDLVMKAALIGSAFTTSDSNPFILSGTQQYTLDGDSNVGRSWNANYREGMVGGMLVGMVYFGGADVATEMLETYDHEAFVAELREAGLSNLVQTFDWKQAHPDSNAPTGELIAAAIAGYRYLGVELSDYMGLYAKLANHTFGKVVKAGVNNGLGINGAGMILSGADGLPNVGKLGMLLEFDSNDANGPRSSAAYSYDGFRTHLANHLVLVAGGYWDASHPAAVEALQRMEIGATDLWYKLDRGYSNYQKGKASGVMRITDQGRGIEYVRAVWDGVVRAYHGF